jgi:hypothetical protein
MALDHSGHFRCAGDRDTDRLGSRCWAKPWPGQAGSCRRAGPAHPGRLARSQYLAGAYRPPTDQDNRDVDGDQSRRSEVHRAGSSRDRNRVALDHRANAWLECHAGTDGLRGGLAGEPRLAAGLVSLCRRPSSHQSGACGILDSLPELDSRGGVAGRGRDALGPSRSALRPERPGADRSVRPGRRIPSLSKRSNRSRGQG